MSLLDKLSKAGSVKHSSILSESEFFGNRDKVTTSLPILNIAFSGEVDGGLVPGITMIGGASRSFKTLLALYCLKAYQEKYPDSVCLFFDAEFGSNPSYFKTYKIDIDRVIHIPVEHIEQLKFDIVKRLDQIERGDRVFILLDSLGALPSKKEIDDALDEKSVADLTRAKAVRSLLRTVNPQLTTKDIPFVIINHVYACGTKDMFVKTENGDKSLKDISFEDHVLTTDGYKPILNKFSFEDELVTDVELEDGTKLSFTNMHRFKVDGKWIYVKDLKEGMVLDSI